MKGPLPQTRNEEPGTRNVLPILLSAAAAFFLFLPTTRFGYVWDELSVVNESLPALVDARSILFPPHAIGDFNQYFRPASYALMRTVLWLAGPSPSAFHLFAVCIHALCSALVAWLALRLMDETEHPAIGALAAGLVFAVHPAHTEAVAWIGATTESLATAWALASLLAYEAARRRGSIGFTALAALFAFFAFGSKETALMLPAGVAGLELHAFTRERRLPSAWPSALGRLAAIALALIAYLVLRRWSLGGWITSPEVTDVEARGLGALPGAVLFYAGQIFVPLAACPFVPEVPPLHLPALLASVLLAGAFGYLALRFWPRSFAACYGAGWLVISLLPPLALAVHTVAAAPVAERYTYAASVGAALVLGCGVAVGSRWLRARQIAVATLCLLGALATTNRLPVFAGHGPFWQTAATCSPQHCLPLLNLGDDAQAAGKRDEAESLYRAALAQPCKPQQVGFAKAHLGVNLYQRGQADEAQSLWRESLRLYGSYSVPHYMLARVAIERAASASSRGDAAAAQENYVVAEEELRAAVALRPRDAEYLYGLGQVQYLLGRGEPARQALRLALEINPNHPAAPAARSMLAK